MKKFTGFFIGLILLIAFEYITYATDTQYTDGDYKYSVSEDGYATIVDYSQSDDATDLVIPSTVSGYEVRAIGERAFASSELTSVTIPSTVTHIGRLAFYYSDYLETINIPSSVTNIEEYIGYRCTSLKNISVEPHSWYYSSVDGSLFSADKRTLIQYALGKEDTSYNVPDSVTAIEPYAFSDCRHLKSIYIPKDVYSIGYRAFDAVRLEKITVNENNEFYCSYNHSLYDKNMFELIRYAGVEVIGEIPDGVEKIADYAFRCSPVTDLIIPKSVKQIGNDISNFNKIYYKSSQSDWGLITKENSNINNCSIYYDFDGSYAKGEITKCAIKMNSLTVTAEFDHMIKESLLILAIKDQNGNLIKSVPINIEKNEENKSMYIEVPSDADWSNYKVYMYFFDKDNMVIPLGKSIDKEII